MDVEESHTAPEKAFNESNRMAGVPKWWKELDYQDQ